MYLGGRLQYRRGQGEGCQLPDNPQHITSLPPGIRTFVYARCNEPRALHNFAEYRNNLRTITLHFERFLCGSSELRCPASGCLREVYTRTASGGYKLTRRYYAKELGR
jgi:hypothetical protein